MDIQTVVYFGICGCVIVIILNSVKGVINKFIELADRLKNLIEVTYHATHDKEFSDKLSKEIENNAKTGSKDIAP